VVDPLGGSWFVEEATDRIEALAEEIFAEIERMGDGSMLEGVLVGIEQGWFQRRIAESAFREQRRYESGDLVKVGVTDFVDATESPIETLVIGEEAERSQVEAVRRTRAARDAGAADDALIALKGAATTDANLMEPLIACARARCTEGEIVGALASVFGTYREAPAF
jgi:methylmalonyl-CoA mutase, N-terminal domain